MFKGDQKYCVKTTIYCIKYFVIILVDICSKCIPKFAKLENKSQFNIQSIIYFKDQAFYTRIFILH